MQGSKYTDAERHTIKQTILEAEFGSLTDNETLALIKVRTSLDIPTRTMHLLKQEAKSDSTVELWLDEYATVGYIEDFKQSLNELKLLRDGLWKQYWYELSKPIEQQKYFKLIRLAETLKGINTEIRYSTFQTPAMRLMKHYIDKGKQVERDNNNKPIRYSELNTTSENGTKSIRSDSREPRNTEDYIF